MTAREESRAVQLAKVAAALQNSPLVKLSGHSGALALLVQYIAEQENRLVALELSYVDANRALGELLARVRLLERIPDADAIASLFPQPSTPKGIP